MSKPRKKYNRNKIANIAVRRMLIVRHSDYEGVVLIDRKTFARMYLSELESDIALKLEHFWHVHTSVFLSINNEEITKTNELLFKDSYKQSDLADYLQSHHEQQILREVQDKVTGYGWIASTNHQTLSEAMIDRIYKTAIKYAS